MVLRRGHSCILIVTTIQVTVGNQTTMTLDYALSYSKPTLTEMMGCNNHSASRTRLIDCNRSGSDLIELNGLNFGPGHLQVFVGGLKCDFVTSSQTNAVCLLPSGTSSESQLILMQATGGFSLPPVDQFSISYAQCPMGSAGTDVVCRQCPIGMTMLKNVTHFCCRVDRTL